jgi:hypothetical protein
VQSGGKIMHTWSTATSTNAAGNWVPNAGIFIVCSDMTLANGAQIIGDGMGYRGGYGANGSGPGLGYYQYQQTAGGGGYGGQGGWGQKAGGVSYGTATNPISPGSSGGGFSNFGISESGGSGGGYVNIAASGSLAVNGTITMNGLNANYGGGGSGGGILIQCQSLAGNGTIMANGGSSTNGSSGYSGGGGGGRIAIYALKAPIYTCPALVAATVSLGTGYQNGTNGTLYLKCYPRGTQFTTW